MPDFLNGGAEGDLPADFREWQRGVTCTVRPDLLRSVPARRRFRLNATVRRIASAGDMLASYAPLYERAAATAYARVARLTCTDPAARARTWIVAHAWLTSEIGTKQVHSATITLGVLFSPHDDEVPEGEHRPGSSSLLIASGGSPESFAAKHLDDSGSRQLDELYVDFANAETDRDVTVSYGEYVNGCHGVDFAAVVARADALAAFYSDGIVGPDAKKTLLLRPLRREWHCLATGKSYDSHIATVHLYFRTSEGRS